MILKSDRSYWFVGFVKSCQERKVCEGLNAIGVETYLPVRREIHRWSDRKKLVDRILIPGMVFVHATDAVRKESLERVSGLHGYMFDRAEGHSSVIKDSDMESFRQFVEHSENAVSISSEPLAPGDRVRVISGPLIGLECELVQVRGTRCIAARLGNIGVATAEIGADCLEKIS